MLNDKIILLTYRNGYVLFDYIEDIIYSYAWIRTNDEYVVVNMIAAEHGYGPLMHDIIMMDNFPNSVRCDNDLSLEEIAVWKFYFYKRNDIEKDKILSSKLLRILDTYDEESLLYSYKQEPKKWFLDLIKKSKYIIFNKKIDVQEIISDGECFFEEKYYTL